MEFHNYLFIPGVRQILLISFVVIQLTVKSPMASNPPSQFERQSLFRSSTLLVCGPDSTTIRCPPRMYIQPLEAGLSTEKKLTSDMDYFTPNCLRNAKSNMIKSVENSKSLYTECFREKTMLKQLKQTCEGRRSCQISTMHLIPNSTACPFINDPILIQYKCFPDHDSTMGEVICADTYMEVKCETQPTVNVLVILGARLDKQIKSTSAFPNGCAALAHESPSGVSEKTCSSRIDITEHMSLLCDGRTSCSVNPNTVNQKGQINHICGKMHLSLIYVCVPPNVVRTRNYANLEDESPNKKQKPIQRQTKGIQMVSIANSKSSNLDPPAPSSLLYLSSHSDNDNQLKIKSGADFQINSQQAHVVPEFQVALLEQPTKTHDDVRSNVVSSSFTSSALIGSGTGFCGLFFILFAVILVCRRSKRKTFVKHQQQQEDKNHKSGQKELMPICFAHPNAWTASNLGCISSLSQPSELGYPCPNCKRPHENYQNSKIESYPTADLSREGCLCVDDKIQPNVTVCSLAGNNSLDTAYCLGSSSTNQSCLLAIPNGEISGTIYAPASSFGGYMYGQMNSHSGVSLPSLHNNSSVSQVVFNPASPNNFSHSCNTPMNADHRNDPNLCKNRGEYIYYGIGTMKTASLAGSSSGRGCDGGSGTTSEKTEENVYKLNSFVGMSKSERREDYETMTDTCSFHQNRCNSQYCTTYSDTKSTKCSYPIQVNLHNSDENGQFIQTNSTTCSPKYIVPHLFPPELSILTKSVIEECQKHTNHSGLTEPKQMKSYNSLTEYQSKFESLGKHVSIHPDSTHCGSLESFSIPVLEPPSSFRTPNHTICSKTNPGDTNNIGFKFIKKSSRPPDLIMKSGIDCTTDADYLEEVEQPPPQMPPLKRITQVRGESNTPY